MTGIVRKETYQAPSLRMADLRLECAFLQSITTGPIEGWTEDPDPEIQI